MGAVFEAHQARAKASGGSRLRAMDDLSLFHGRADDQAMGISVTLDFFRSNDQGIYPDLT